MQKITFETTHLKQQTQHEHSKLLGELLERKKAEEITDTEILQLHADIVQVHDDGTFSVKSHDGQALFPVFKAFSCLHQPMVGDKVLLSGCVRDGFYILTILYRPIAKEPVVLDLGEEVQVKARALSFHAQEVNIESQYYRQHAGEYQLNSANVVYRIKNLQSYVASVEENYSQVQRYVTGTEQVHALNFTYTADQIVRIQGNHTFINGEKLLKSDGQLMMVG